MLLDFLYLTFIYPIIYIFPAYAANGAPVIFGGGAPLDLKKKFHGKRIFGDHKTIRGTLSSVIAGIAVGALEFPFFPYMLIIAIFLTIGANFGDLIGSYIKRRLRMESGKHFPIFDQYGFFIFALIFALPFGHLPDLYGILFLIAITGITHLLTNKGAYKLNLKNVPW